MSEQSQPVFTQLKHIRAVTYVIAFAAAVCFIVSPFVNMHTALTSAATVVYYYNCGSVYPMYISPEVIGICFDDGFGESDQQALIDADTELIEARPITDSFSVVSLRSWLCLEALIEKLHQVGSLYGVKYASPCFNYSDPYVCDSTFLTDEITVLFHNWISVEEIYSAGAGFGLQVVKLIDRTSLHGIECEMRSEYAMDPSPFDLLYVSNAFDQSHTTICSTPVFLDACTGIYWGPGGDDEGEAEGEGEGETGREGEGEGEPEVPYRFGDVDSSGGVDVLDMQRVINAVLGIPTVYNCDLNDDGYLDAIDVQLVAIEILNSS